MSQPTRHRREIWASLCIGNTVSDILWRQAREAGRHVGTCRKRLPNSGAECGQLLRPGEPYEQGRVTWYPAECPSGHETAAHGARPAKAS